MGYIWKSSKQKIKGGAFKFDADAAAANDDDEIMIIG